MSDAFRCDACDCYYSGRPAATVTLTPEYGTVGDPLTVGHVGGRDDVDPEGLTRAVEWPFGGLGKRVELCVLCAAERGFVETLRELLMAGRHGPEARTERHG